VEEIVDAIVEELNTFATTSDGDGGLLGLFEIQTVYFGDPGILIQRDYPLFIVSPEEDTPVSETTGYYVRDSEVSITLIADVGSSLDGPEFEISGSRMLTHIMDKVRAWFLRQENRTLHHMSGVQNLQVLSTDYYVQQRGPIFVKGAQITLTVRKQYPRIQ